MFRPKKYATKFSKEKKFFRPFSNRKICFKQIQLVVKYFRPVTFAHAQLHKLIHLQTNAHIETDTNKHTYTQTHYLPTQTHIHTRTHTFTINTHYINPYKQTHAHILTDTLRDSHTHTHTKL